MKQLLCAMCFCVVLAGCQHKPTFSTMVDNSVTVCFGDKSHGSGVFIGPNIVVTAGHCVDGYPTYIVLDDGTEMAVLSTVRHPVYDVGILVVDGTHTFSALGDIDKLAVGDTIYHVGTPLYKEWHNSLFVGVVSYLDRDWYDWKGTIQGDFWGAAGCSGGGVFNSRDEVIGIVVGGRTDGACAVICEPVDHIVDTLKMLPGE